MKKPQIYIGTSGWHYHDWIGTFYPPEVTGYHELAYHAKYFDTVENNASFYRIAGAGTYKTWVRMTPEHYKFSMKLNRLITHIHRLTLNDEVEERVRYILDTTQVLGSRMGAMVIQLPPNLRYDLDTLNAFLSFFTTEIRSREYHFDIAIEFRNKHWFNESVYSVLKEHNVALIAGQSSRYPLVRHITADVAYIRMHGPEKLFASKYTEAQLNEWAEYIKTITTEVRRVYVYFNNDFYGYAIENALYLKKVLA